MPPARLLRQAHALQVSGLAIMFCGASIAFPAQSSFVQTPLAGTLVRSAAAIPDAIAGQVTNAVTGAPIARALVQINGRGMLTDQEGRFRFEQPGETVAALRFNKPGFSTTPEQMDSSGDASLDGSDAASLTVALWPESILAGTVTAPDGERLPHISVVARHSIFDEQGHHFQIAGQVQTDSHGQFRIPVTAGDYVLETQYSARGFERDEAVLATSFPPGNAKGAGGLIHVNSGEEQHFDLRPGVSRTHTLSLPIDGEDGRPQRITAHSSDGAIFSANGFRSQEPGMVRLNLPMGTYSLQATRFSPGGLQFWDSTVTMPDHDIAGAPLRLSDIPGIPVEIVADTSNAQTLPAGGARRLLPATPNVMQLNVALEPLEFDPTSPFQFGIRATQQRDNSPVIVAAPGVYRLNAGLASGWYISSASSRGTDLMRENLVISPGSSPSPITIVVSNQTGSVQGTVKLSGSPCACWVYLIANSPALPAVISRRADASGVFHVTDLPPGSYRAVAFPFRHSADLQDPDVLNRFVTRVGSVTITPGATESLDLDSVTVKELVQ